jgi:hypothetical protein
LKTKADWSVLLSAWLIVGSLLPFIPMAAQRRFVQGWSFPIAIFAGYAVGAQMLPGLARNPAFTKRSVMAAAAAIVLLLAASSLTYVGFGIRQVRERPFAWYHDRTRERALQWLAANTNDEDVVLCSPWSGLLIPPRAGNRVVMGHWAETLHLGEKLDQFRAAFGPDSTLAARREFVERFNVRYFFFSSQERRDLPNYDPALDTALWRPVWREGLLGIYERVD